MEEVPVSSDADCRPEEEDGVSAPPHGEVTQQTEQDATRHLHTTAA